MDSNKAVAVLREALTDELIDNACYGFGFNDFHSAVLYDRAIVRKVFDALATTTNIADGVEADRAATVAKDAAEKTVYDRRVAQSEIGKFENMRAMVRRQADRPGEPYPHRAKHIYAAPISEASDSAGVAGNLSMVDTKWCIYYDNLGENDYTNNFMRPWMFFDSEAEAQRYIDSPMSSMPLKHYTPKKVLLFTPQQKAKAECAATQPAEAVTEYQFRMRADWNCYWSPWERCTADSYADYVKTPLVNDWHYEARALGIVAAAPTPDRAPHASTAGRKWRDGPMPAEIDGELANAIMDAPCNWKGAPELHSAILMGHTMACEQGAVLAMKYLAATEAPDLGARDAADFIEKRAQEYLDGNAGTEHDTGAITWHYGEAGRDYYNTLTELAEEIRALSPTPAIAPAGAAVTSADHAKLERVIACAEILNKRPRPMCRDCADEDGTCPNSGLDCDMRNLLADARAILAKSKGAA